MHFKLLEAGCRVVRAPRHLERAGACREMLITSILTPRAGYEYQLAVRHKQDIYDVALREVDRKGAGRELPRRPLSGC